MFKFYFATILAKTAHLLAILAINIAGKGTINIEIEGNYKKIDWDCIGGIFLLILFISVFWVITPK